MSPLFAESMLHTLASYLSMHTVPTRTLSGGHAAARAEVAKERDAVYMPKNIMTGCFMPRFLLLPSLPTVAAWEGSISQTYRKQKCRSAKADVSSSAWGGDRFLRVSGACPSAQPNHW